MCLPLYYFLKVSLLGILVSRKSNDTLRKFFIFHPSKMVHVQEMIIILYF
jgi:hypothetical protein